MALKNNGSRAMSSNSNQLNRSAAMNNTRALYALGDLSQINPESRPSTAPFSSGYLPQPMAAANTSAPGVPPALPPKRSPYMPAYSRYSPVSNYFSPYSRYTPGYPGMGMGMGYGMSPYGSPYAGSGSYSSFTQLAEESTRPAFESIESVVEVVSSISMMLESTYHAVHSSYSAILGVVDQFSRLKDHFTQVLSVLALLRWLRWICLKVLYLLGVRKENPTVEAAWNSAEKLASSSTALDVPSEARASAWPFFMFLGLVVGAPWLMFKLLAKSIAQPKPFDPRDFECAKGRKYMAVAAYDFKATQAGELSFKAGERLMISPKSMNANRGGWYFAANEKQETGMIPSTYLRTSNRNNTRNIPMHQRTPVPELNIMPNEAVSETETIVNADDSVNTAENPVSIVVEKAADSPDLTDVVIDKPQGQPVETPDSKSNSSTGSD